MTCPPDSVALPGGSERSAADLQRRTLAPFGRRRAEVLDVRPVGAYLVVAVADPVAVFPRPGQFYMLASAERWGGGESERPFLPRAFSVMRVGPTTSDTPVLEFMLEDVGPGTRRLAELQAGERLWLAGPLGLGFELPPPSVPVVLVAGGVGLAPLVMLDDLFEDQGRERQALVGFRDGAHAAGSELIRAPQVSTDDGSVGRRGLVTEALDAVLSTETGAWVYACGPPPMLEGVRRLSAGHQVRCQLALEAGMACGFGACFGCVIATRQGYRRVCVDGPVFDARELETVLVSGHDGHPRSAARHA
ncbi:MAG TPA: hypothetical protein VGN69_04690 [Solirubrobacteraceae bacterium]|jgi:NAD(P)H-flavin reductase|nr:hypothetical protein [Solirubrobacteraceae bacterium]